MPGLARRSQTVLATAASLALLPGTGAAAGQATGFFKTRSGNIVCAYGYGKSVQQPFLVCGIKSGLRPAPPRSGAACKHLDYVGNRIGLGPSGGPHTIACAGDAGPFASPPATPVLPSEQSWHGGGFTCTAEESGLSCHNAKGHGFFLGRLHWHGF